MASLVDLIVSLEGSGETERQSGRHVVPRACERKGKPMEPVTSATGQTDVTTDTTAEAEAMFTEQMAEVVGMMVFSELIMEAIQDNEE